MRSSPLHERDHQSQTTPEEDDPAPSSDQTARRLVEVELPSLEVSPIRARYQANEKQDSVGRITTLRIPDNFIHTHSWTENKDLNEELTRSLTGPIANTSPVNSHG